MVKTLDKLTKGAKRVTATLLAIASLGTASCQQAGVNPKEYYNPTANLTVSPTSGTAPLESRLFLNGSDADGDISKSYVFADYDGDGGMDSGEQLASVNSGSIDQNYIFTRSGTFKVYGQCEDDQGNIGTSSPVTMTIQPQIIDPDAKYIISGELQDNESDSIQSGEVKLFINGIESAVDSDGNDFYFEVPANSEVKLKGTMKNGTTPESYTRTLNLGNVNENKTEIQLRAVPYDASWTSQQINYFPIHVGRGNFWSATERINAGLNGEYVNGNSQHGLKKPGTFQGIKVSTSLPDYASIVSAINAEGIQAIPDTDPHSESGYGIILPGAIGAGTYTILYDLGADGYVERFETYLNTTDPLVRAHEWKWHGIMACVGHTNGSGVSELFPSIGRYQSSYPTTSIKEDEKIRKIVDEPTYLGNERLGDILGL